MSEKQPAFRYLAQGGKGGRQADGSEPLGLSVPTLEERARFFLRAVHGDLDFTSGQRAEAQSTILNAMAADIAAKSKSRMTGEPSAKPTSRAIGPLPTGVMYAPEFEEDQPRCPNKTEALRPLRPADAAAHEPRQAPTWREDGVQMSLGGEAAPALRPSTSTAVRRLVPRASLGVSLPPVPAPTPKPANRGLFIWSAALFILAGLCVLGALTFYQTTTRSESVAAESARGVMPLAVPPLAPSNGAVMPLPVAPAARSNDESNAIDIGRPATDVSASIQLFLPATKDIERSRAGLIERVRTVKFAAGDIEAGRVALSRLVEGGNAWAAVDLGSTYDPNILNALGIRSFPADATKARAWYQMAQQMGSPEAVGLLESLERSERRSRCEDTPCESDEK
jgi:hypothetical protein